MDNMYIYNQVCTVPESAKKTIAAGRLKGMTDIKPMWRIKKITEIFGPCGTGWYYDIINFWTEHGADGVISAFAQINLYYKTENEWSKPVSGVGGSSFVSKEKGGMYTSDECYKMALTDAISVAAKSLGVGADVYWSSGSSKYSNNTSKECICRKCGKTIKACKSQNGTYSSSEEISKMTGGLCITCARVVNEQ